jgi:hypothetical protein
MHMPERSAPEGSGGETAGVLEAAVVVRHPTRRPAQQTPGRLRLFLVVRND